MSRKRARKPNWASDGVERHALRVEALEQAHAALDGSGEHCRPFAVPGLDQGRLVGMAGGEFTDILGHRQAGVTARMPFHGADGGQKILHRRLVGTEVPAVHVARVPVDQHPAEVEDDHGHGVRPGRQPQPWRALKRRWVLLMT